MPRSRDCTEDLMLHLALHFIVPAILAGLFFRKRWKGAYFVMIATMLVDLDHLLADPIYDASRCSIGFHPLHQPWLIAAYLALCFVPKAPVLRLVGIGLVVHMALDAVDCQVTNGVWLNATSACTGPESERLLLYDGAGLAMAPAVATRSMPGGIIAVD
jgi:hypothetical protein